jgi:hypothetical protein
MPSLCSTSVLCSLEGGCGHCAHAAAWGPVSSSRFTKGTENVECGIVWQGIPQCS